MMNFWHLEKQIISVKRTPTWNFYQNWGHFIKGMRHQENGKQGMWFPSCIIEEGGSESLILTLMSFYSQYTSFYEDTTFQWPSSFNVEWKSGDNRRPSILNKSASLSFKYSDSRLNTATFRCIRSNLHISLMIIIKILPHIRQLELLANENEPNKQISQAFQQQRLKHAINSILMKNDSMIRLDYQQRSLPSIR